MILDQVDRETRDVLERFGFDADRFETLRVRVASGELSPASNVASGRVEPPADDDVTRLPDPGSDGWAEARQAGVAALESGRIAQVVLAGGMATRFGGVVKGVVEALDGRSFLSWKLGETARLADALGAEIPVALMTSFATADETRAHVDSLDLPEPLWFSQFVSLRLTESGTSSSTTAGRRSTRPATGTCWRRSAARARSTPSARVASSTSPSRTSTTSVRASTPS